MIEIVAGRRARHEQVGYVMEFCVCCHAPQVHTVTDVFSVVHVYWIPLGRGQHVAREIACDACGYTEDRKGGPHSLLFKERLNHAVMLESVSAGIRDDWAAVMARERSLRANAEVLSPAERRAALLSVFQIYEKRAQRDVGGQIMVSGYMGVLIAIWSAFIVLLFSLAPLLLRAVDFREVLSSSSGNAMAATFTVLLSMGVFGIYFVVSYQGVYLRRHVERPLAAALAELRPKPEELAELRKDLAHRCFITADVNMDRLLNHIALQGGLRGATPSPSEPTPKSE